MEALSKIVGSINSFIWGPIIIVFLVGTGLILTIGTRVIQFRKMGYAFKLLFSKQDMGEGDITPFQALMTSLAATIGTGNIAGVARGVFSNEAGLGSAPIAHAASKNDDPVKQGIIASLGSFLDTIVVCTMTALVILTSGLVTIGADGVMSITDNLKNAALTTTAFQHSFGLFGAFIVSFGLIFFAFSTILGWFYYGSKCIEYIAGYKTIQVYKGIFVLLVFIGAFYKSSLVWDISDTFNGAMAIPNLIALLFLSPMVFEMTNDYDFEKNK